MAIRCLLDTSLHIAKHIPPAVREAKTKYPIPVTPNQTCLRFRMLQIPYRQSDPRRERLDAAPVVESFITIQ